MDMLKEQGFIPFEMVSCKCKDDARSWSGIVKEDHAGRYYIEFNGGVYYPDRTDELEHIGGF